MNATELVDFVNNELVDNIDPLIGRELEHVSHLGNDEVGIVVKRIRHRETYATDIIHLTIFTDQAVEVKGSVRLEIRAADSNQILSFGRAYTRDSHWSIEFYGYEIPIGTTAKIQLKP